MKNTQNGSRRWIPFGTVKRRGVRVGLVATLALSMAACVPMIDRCDRMDAEGDRVIRVSVDEEVLFWTIKSSGACTELVEVAGVVGSREWETTMTGPVGSTCTVRLDIGSKILEEKTTFVAHHACNYPGADNIGFHKE